MSLTDWIAKYPQVQALLQQPEDVLAYWADGDGDAARPPALPSLEGVEPEVLTPQDIAGEVTEVLAQHPTATLARVLDHVAWAYSLEVPELLALCPHLAEVYATARAELLEALHLRLVSAQRCLAATASRDQNIQSFATRLQATIQAMEAMGDDA
jgi:hypothetical protein